VFCFEPFGKFAPDRKFSPGSRSKVQGTAKDCATEHYDLFTLAKSNRSEPRGDVRVEARTGDAEPRARWRVGERCVGSMLCAHV
jgi:hypothetical protein